MNYITLKPVPGANIFLSQFNHIRELHHSQTCLLLHSFGRLFNHIRELHHSQTVQRNRIRKKSFNHIRELHHSQTLMFV